MLYGMAEPLRKAVRERGFSVRVYAPVGELIPAIQSAGQIARRRGAEIRFVASLTGTELDPQGFESQRQMLKEAGTFHVVNAAATE
jgi:hypothetical protein